MEERDSTHPFDESEDPLWCEDCELFGNADMSGEGICGADGHDTWYGCPICEKVKLKEGEHEQKETVL